MFVELDSTSPCGFNCALQALAGCLIIIVIIRIRFRFANHARWQHCDSRVQRWRDSRWGSKTIVITTISRNAWAFDCGGVDWLGVSSYRRHFCGDFLKTAWITMHYAVSTLYYLHVLVVLKVQEGKNEYSDTEFTIRILFSNQITIRILFSIRII